MKTIPLCRIFEGCRMKGTLGVVLRKATILNRNVYVVTKSEGSSILPPFNLTLFPIVDTNSTAANWNSCEKISSYIIKKTQKQDFSLG